MGPRPTPLPLAAALGATALSAAAQYSSPSSLVPVGGSGRFNKGYCFHGNAWGNASFWEGLIAAGTNRVAQFTTINTTGTYYLGVVVPSSHLYPSSPSLSSSSSSPLGTLALTATPTNVTIDLGCNNRSMPDYSAISFGTYPPAGGGGGGGPGGVVWAEGPIGDHTAAKVARCWWVRCDVNETQADTCGSEGESPCDKTAATFNRYVSPYPGYADGTPPPEDSACYPITLDSQVDPTHRVDFLVRFVDGLWPPPGA
jgi:hypothetical protein